MELKVNEIAIPERIAFNYEELKQELAERVKLYETMVYTDDQVKLAKADKATLTKLKKALNDERLRREREYMAPFNEFKAQVNEIIRIIDKPIAMIDSQVKAFEDARKAEKQAKILEYFKSISSAAPWLSFERVFNPRWLNVTVSMNVVQAELDELLERIKGDMLTLDSLQGFGFEAKEVYKQTLDLNKAIAEGKRLADLQRRKAEEMERRKAAEVQQPAPKQEPVEVVRPAEPVEVEPEEPTRQWIAFKAFLSAEDAAALKQFFTERDIEFAPVVGR